MMTHDAALLIKVLFSFRYSHTVISPKYSSLQSSMQDVYGYESSTTILEIFKTTGTLTLTYLRVYHLMYSVLQDSP
jgi:hypothetical protein